jgi:hypothetical protein
MFKTLEKLRFYSANFLVYPIKNKHLALHKAKNLRQCAISLVCDPYEHHSFPDLSIACWRYAAQTRAFLADEPQGDD